jgi:hypothetical protein
MNKLNSIIICSILLLVAAVCWLNRANFVTKFDYEYVRTFYDHSHWTVPATQRRMGDALLYQIAGYELVTKSSFTEINPEAPPLGKYLIGWSILLTGSALWVNIFLYFFLLFFCYLICLEIFKHSWQRSLTIWLIAWQPLLWQQLFQSMLDLGQVAWLMGWLWAVIKLIQAKTKSTQFIFSLMAGLFLGLFVSTKIAFFIAPLLIIVGGWLIYLKKFSWTILSLIVTGIIYTCMYSPQIFSTGLLSALSLQKWILNYWLSSSSRPIYGISLVVLATGWYLGHWQQAAWNWLPVWNPIWLIGLLGIAHQAYFNIKHYLKKMLFINLAQVTVLLCSLALLASLSLVPLFDRYLVVILPVLIMSAVLAVTQQKKFWQNSLFFLVVIYTLIQTLWLLPPSLTEAAKEISRVASVPAYQDLWSFVDQETQVQVNRDQFWHELETARYQGQLKNTKWSIILPIFYSNWQTQVPVNIKIEQTTELGNLNYEQTAKLVRQNGKWVLAWNPNLFLPGWKPNRKIELETKQQNGQVINVDGQVLAKDGEVPTIYVIPSQIKDELALNAQIEQLTGLGKPHQELMYKVDQLPDLAYYIGPVFADVEIPSAEKLAPGLEIIFKPGRIYHPNVIEDRTRVFSLMSIEGAEPNLLTYPAGELKIVDESQPGWSETLLKTASHPAHHLKLNYNFLSQK